MIKLNKIQKISIKVVLLFAVAMASTFLGEYLRDFFGDWKCEGSGERIGESYHYSKCDYGSQQFHLASWHWGYRHWLYLCMCAVLFLIQAIDIISYADSNRE